MGEWAGLEDRHMKTSNFKMTKCLYDLISNEIKNGPLAQKPAESSELTRNGSDLTSEEAKNVMFPKMNSELLNDQSKPSELSSEEEPDSDPDVESLRKEAAEARQKLLEAKEAKKLSRS